MTDERFEDELRRGLATLAREAVSEVAARPAAGVADVVAVVFEDRERRAGRRVLAAAVAVTVVAAAVALAAALRHDDTRSGRVETPQPSVTVVPASPLGPRDSQVSVFTGKEVIVWGGHDQFPSNTTPPATATASAADPSHPTARADGAAYDVVTGRWRSLPPAPIAGRYLATGAWTGSEMVVVGGLTDTLPATERDVSRQGAAYDPAHNRWRRIPDSPVCSYGIGTWTGTRLVVGGNCSGTPFQVAAYDPVRNTWTGLPAPPDASRLVAVGARLFAWNGHDNRGSQFDAGTRKWRPLPALRAGGIVDSIAVAFHGTQLAVVGPQVDARGETLSEVELDLLDPSGRSWDRVTSTEVNPPQDSVVSMGDGLVWDANPGYGWFGVDPATGTGEISSVNSGPVSLYRSNGTLLTIGDRRVFFWGGQSIPKGVSGMSQPSADGGIIQFP